MDIKFYNSLTNKIEKFIPLFPGEVSLYVCGPTVYNDAHLGNMRPAIVFDTLRNFLEYVGYKVKFVSNLTDVDDKIIQKAVAENVDEQTISTRYIHAYNDLLNKVHVKKYYVQPRVTRYMDVIIDYIDDLVKNGSAYQVDGDVYFRVNSIENYGELSKIDVEANIVGARVEENSKKESPLDFTLWKKTSVGIRWKSPWSEGRPGWHTECGAMIDSIFGGLIDIHGGGLDLKFPHHENEIAQAKARNNNTLARYWLHNGFVRFENDKMSKSLGNVILAKDFLADHSGNLLRLLMLSSHYRAPLNFSKEIIDAGQNELDKIEGTFKKLYATLKINDIDFASYPPEISAFISSMSDDLNTPNALTNLYSEIKEANNNLRSKVLDFEKLKKNFSSIYAMTSILGLVINWPDISDEDKKMYQQYLAFKANKQFKESDELRPLLMQKYIL